MTLGKRLSEKKRKQLADRYADCEATAKSEKGLGATEGSRAQERI